jgi:endonuclease G, mitochondrial
MGELITQIKEAKVANVQIQYDHNRELALKLAAQILAQTQMQAELVHSNPPESSTTQYERNRVTAIIHLK